MNTRSVITILLAGLLILLIMGVAGVMTLMAGWALRNIKLKRFGRNLLHSLNL